MKKLNASSVAVIFIIALLLCVFMLIIVDTTVVDVVYADEQHSSSDINEICEEFTKKINLQIETEKTILQYEAYIDERFNIGGSSQSAEGITDEWIFQIVPKAVFDMRPNNFLYIGGKYGFYVDYDSANDEYFVYLLLHEFDYQTTSGHIEQTIRPLYYEKYKIEQHLIFYFQLKNIYHNLNLYYQILYNKNYLNQHFVSSLLL